MRRAMLFDALGALSCYPGVEHRLVARRAVDAARTGVENGFSDSAMLLPPDAAAALETFATSTCALNGGELEELYTRTFDIAPVCALELGWHLHGESYDRGALLVSMRALLASHGVPENGELPDHLSHALALFGRLSDEAAAEFARERLLPAVAAMRAGLRDTDHPYDHLLRAVEAIAGVWHDPSPEIRHDTHAGAAA